MSAKARASRSRSSEFASVTRSSTCRALARSSASNTERPADVSDSATRRPVRRMFGEEAARAEPRQHAAQVRFVHAELARQLRRRRRRLGLGDLVEHPRHRQRQIAARKPALKQPDAPGVEPVESAEVVDEAHVAPPLCCLRQHYMRQPGAAMATQGSLSRRPAPTNTWHPPKKRTWTADGTPVSDLKHECYFSFAQWGLSGATICGIAAFSPALAAFRRRELVS